MWWCLQYLFSDGKMETGVGKISATSNRALDPGPKCGIGPSQVVSLHCPLGFDHPLSRKEMDFPHSPSDARWGSG